jgi:hypothetical protein
MKLTIKNNARAGRGFYDINVSRILVMPGQTVTVDVDEVTANDIIGNADFMVISDMPVTVDPIIDSGNPVETDHVPDSAKASDFFADMTDEEFAAVYEAEMGKKPHHLAKRETLIAHLLKGE